MFQVPEQYRISDGPLASTVDYGNNGAFAVPACIAGRNLWVIAADGYGWEHVSVHCSNGKHKRFTPTWKEMCHIKNLFWDAEDCVMQLHPPESQWINTHDTTLHLWRPIDTTIPQPPGMLVGISGATETHMKFAAPTSKSRNSGS